MESTSLTRTYTLKDRKLKNKAVVAEGTQVLDPERKSFTSTDTIFASSSNGPIVSHYISMPKYEFEQKIASLATEQSNQFNKLSKMLQQILNVRLFDLKKRMEISYEILSSSNSNSPDEKKNLENDFFTNLLRILNTAKFTFVSQDEWLFAKQDGFLFTLPFKMKWEEIDSETISRVMDHSSFTNAEKFGKKIMLLRRGFGKEQHDDYFFYEKIDVLLERAYRQTKKFIIPEKFRPHLNMNFVESKTGIVIERKLLRDMNTRDIFRNFFTKLTIQEPTYSEVLVMYKFKDKPVVQLKAFDNLPIADTEVALPHSGIALNVRLRDQLQIGIYAIFILYMLYYQYTSTSINWEALGALMMVILARIYSVVSWIQIVQQQNSEELTKILYTKNVASDEALLSYLVQSANDQVLKEYLMGYYVLWSNPNGLTNEKFREECVLALEKVGMFVEFDEKSCLVGLVEEKLVTEENGIYKAVELEQALENLNKGFKI